MDCFNKRFGLTALAAVFFVAGCASNQAVDGGNKPVVTEIKSDLPVDTLLSPLVLSLLSFPMHVSLI